MSNHTTLIAFDLDGTLLNTESLNIPDMVAFLRSTYNLPITVETWETEGYHGLAGSGLLSKLHADYGLEVDLAEFRTLREARIPALFAQGVEAAPGVADVLMQLEAAGQLMCVASNSQMERIKISFQHARPQIGGYLGGHLFSGTEEGSKPKPAPDVYLAAAAHFKLNPAQCLAVEDSANGAGAAIAAGYTVVGYTGLAKHPMKEAAELHKAGVHHLISHWDEFLPLLNTLS